MRHRVATLAATALALAAGTLLVTGGPAAADDGFKVTVSHPGTFTTGANPKKLAAVVSSGDAKRCRKVRWSLTVRTKGVSIDQVKVVRVENGRQFASRAQAGDGVARFVDVAPDPGQVCKGRTDTAEWEIAFLGPDNGEVTFEAHAVDGASHPLAAGKADSRVVTGEAASSPSPTPTTPPATDDSAAPLAPITANATKSAAAVGLVTPPADPNLAKVSSSSTLGIGLIIGAILVIGGVGLLLWLRRRNRDRPGRPGGGPAWQGETQMLPTGFYNHPKRQR